MTPRDERSRSPRRELIPDCTKNPSFEAALYREYEEKVARVERLNKFKQPRELNAAYFTAKPMVLVLGPTSAGKTTLIEHFLGCEYPNSAKGPEPTTDKFNCLLYNDVDAQIPGKRLVLDSNFPFTQLADSHEDFQANLRCAMLPSPILRELTIIDTPGILSSSDVKRGFSLEWAFDRFATLVDMVLIVFDINRLDLCDQMKQILQSLYKNGHKDKICIVMNKADQKSQLEHARAYGGLMWSLGQVIKTAEIPRVFVGSFRDGPLLNDNFRILFDESKEKLDEKFKQLSLDTADRKYQAVCDRAKVVLLHANLMEHVRKRLPWRIRWSQKQQLQMIGGFTLDACLDNDYKLANHTNEEQLAQLREEMKTMNFFSFQEILPTLTESLAQSLRHLPSISRLISGKHFSGLPSLPPAQNKLKVSA